MLRYLSLSVRTFASELSNWHSMSHSARIKNSLEVAEPKTAEVAYYKAIGLKRLGDFDKAI